MPPRDGIHRCSSVTNSVESCDKRGARAGESLLLLVAWFFVVVPMLEQFWSHTSDDAFISLRYVENLRKGNGLVYNAGERVEAFTDLLWIVLTRVFDVLVGDPLLTVKLLGVVCSFLTVVVVLSAAKTRASGDDHVFPRLRIVVLVMFGVHTPFWLWTLGGLEAPLYALLLLLVSYYLVPSGPFPNSRLWALASLALALTRPEGLAVCLLILIAAAVIEARADFRSLFKWGCVAVGAYLLIRVVGRLYFGHVFPTSYLIRVSSDSGMSLLKRRVSIGFSYLMDYARFYWMHVPIIVGATRLALARRIRLSGAQERTTMLTYITVAVIGSMAVVVYFGGDSKIYYRLLVPVFPLLVTGLVLALKDVLLLLRHKLATDVVIAAFVVMYGSAFVIGNPFESDDRNWRRFNKEHRLLAERTMAGLWIRDHTVCAATIVAPAAGATPFFSERLAYDGCLTQYATAERPFTRDLDNYRSYVMTGHTKYYLEDVIREKEPCVLVGGKELAGYRRECPFPGFRTPIAVHNACSSDRLDVEERYSYVDEALRRLHYTKSWRTRVRSQLTARWNND